jgi:hypothetical protein
MTIKNVIAVTIIVAIAAIIGNVEVFLESLFPNP